MMFTIVGIILAITVSPWWLLLILLDIQIT